MSFWLDKSLKDMNEQEWESLCDGCAKCCLHVLQDEDDASLAYTSVACRLLNIQTCRCTQYDSRQNLVPDCTQITPETIESYYWLPETCAYRLVFEKKDLPDWHHLKSGGDKTKMHKNRHSVKKTAISEQVVQPDAYEEYIVRWVEPGSH